MGVELSIRPGANDTDQLSLYYFVSAVSTTASNRVDHPQPPLGLALRRTLSQPQCAFKQNRQQATDHDDLTQCHASLEPFIRESCGAGALLVRTFSAAALGGGIHLIVDGSKVGFGHQLLMVAVAYRRRALPLAWTWVPSSRGHASARKQRALLSYVYTLVPPQSAVLIVGDSEFGAVEVLRQLEAWGWHYVLRQKSSHLVSAPSTALLAALSPGPLPAALAWQPLGHLITQAGHGSWLADVALTQLHAQRTNLLLHWQPGEHETWFLATNLP